MPYLNYQWQFNGADIPGAQGAVLGLTNIVPPQAGNYTARVRNSAGRHQRGRLLAGDDE